MTKRKLAEIVRDIPPPIALQEILEAPILTKRSPIGGQKAAIDALYTAFKKPPKGQRPLFILSGKEGEGIGVGKTHISISVAMALLEGKGRVLVLVPPHLTEKWRDEVAKDGGVPILPRKVRDILSLKEREPEGVEFVIFSKDTAKRPIKKTTALAPSRLSPMGFACPSCGVPLDPKEVDERCPACGEFVLQEVGGGTFGKVLVRFARELFDFLILDEGHAFRNKEAQQTVFACRLIGRLPTLVLSGTIMGGMASDLLVLLKGAYPHLRDLREKEFIEGYGSLVAVKRRVYGGKNPPKNPSKPRYEEAPGFSPNLWPLVLGQTVFIGLKDVAQLPPLHEKTSIIPLTGEQEAFLGAIREAIAIPRPSRRDNSIGGSAAFYGPDVPGVDRIFFENKGEVPVPPIPFDGLLPKEEALLTLVNFYRKRGERILLFVEGTGVWDVQGRLYELLWDDGHNPFVLTADIPPAKRYEVTRNHPADVLITNPRLVETGLDLVEYTVAIFFQPPRSPFTLRQATRRIYRLGQTKEVKVHYLAYEGVQAGILAWVGEKVRQSLLFEGALESPALEVLPEDPMELAARILRGEVKPGEVGSIFVSPALPALPVLPRERVVRIGRKKAVLPAGQPVLFEEVL
jgi:hypothetical protein